MDPNAIKRLGEMALDTGNPRRSEDLIQLLARLQVSTPAELQALAASKPIAEMPDPKLRNFVKGVAATLQGREGSQDGDDDRRDRVIAPRTSLPLRDVITAMRENASPETLRETAARAAASGDTDSARILLYASHNIGHQPTGVARLTSADGLVCQIPTQDVITYGGETYALDKLTVGELVETAKEISGNPHSVDTRIARLAIMYLAEMRDDARAPRPNFKQLSNLPYGGDYAHLRAVVYLSQMRTFLQSGLSASDAHDRALALVDGELSSVNLGMKGFLLAAHGIYSNDKRSTR